MWNFQNINVTFFDWRIILSEKWYRNVPKLTTFIELYDVMHLLLGIAPCLPEGLFIHSVCRYVSIFLEVLWGVQQGIKANMVKNGRFKIKLLRLCGPWTNVPCDMCTDEQAMWWIYLQCLFNGKLTFMISQGLFCMGWYLQRCHGLASHTLSTI